jgi:hypothetical protein
MMGEGEHQRNEDGRDPIADLQITVIGEKSCICIDNTKG